jgi:hypothetical protein
VFGAYAFATGYFGQSPFGGVFVPYVPEPDVLELVASFSGALDVLASASDGVSVDAAFSAAIDLVATVES